jgi:hypothetical protein
LFYKRRSQGKKHPLRLEIFLLRSPPDRARSVLTYRAMFYKRRSQGKKHPLRLEIFLLRSPPDRARSVLTYRAMCPVAGQCDPVVWAFSTSGFHLFFATKPVSSETSKAERGQIWRP